MQRQEDEKSSVELPDELIVHIISFLSVEEMKAIPFVSHHLYGIASEFFLNNLFGQSLRFNKWQQDKIKKLKDDCAVFTNSHQVTLFNQPQSGSFGRGINYLNHGIMIGGLPYCLYMLVKMIGSEDTSDNFTIIKILFILALVVAISNIVFQSLLNRLANREFAASSITSQHLDELNDFINKNPIFLKFFSMDHFQVGVTSVSQLLNFTKNCVDEIISLSDSFINYVKDEARFSSRTKLSRVDIENLNHIHPNLPIYASYVFNLWANTNNKKEVFFPSPALKEENVSDLDNETLKNNK